jgi:hypothetical protein
MNQFSFENKYLKIKVAKSPILVRLPLFTITFLCFALPSFGLILNIIEGEAIKFGGVLVFGLFSLMGFYLLRLSLWNQFGQEVIQFNEDEIVYIADYHWFKDGKKTINRGLTSYSINALGDENENKGTLVISNGESEIESVVKMPTESLEELIKILKNEG